MSVEQTFSKDQQFPTPVGTGRLPWGDLGRSEGAGELQIGSSVGLKCHSACSKPWVPSCHLIQAMCMASTGLPGCPDYAARKNGPHSSRCDLWAVEGVLITDYCPIQTLLVRSPKAQSHFWQHEDLFCRVSRQQLHTLGLEGDTAENS